MATLRSVAIGMVVGVGETGLAGWAACAGSGSLGVAAVEMKRIVMRCAECAIG